MATKSRTKAAKVQEVVAKPLSRDAANAALWRSQGKPIQYILDNTSFNSAAEALEAVREHNNEMATYHRNDRRRNQYERFEAINAVMSEAWDIVESPPHKYDREGVDEGPDQAIIINALKIIIDCQKQLMVLQGLNKDDIRDVVAETLFISGTQAEFIEATKKAIEAAKPVRAPAD